MGETSLDREHMARDATSTNKAENGRSLRIATSFRDKDTNHAVASYTDPTHPQSGEVFHRHAEVLGDLPVPFGGRRHVHGQLL